MRLKITIIPLLLLLAACGGSGGLNKGAIQQEDEYLIIGENGGATGGYTEYILYPNGRVEVWDELDQKSTFKGNISKQEATPVFEKWVVLKDLNASLFKPGNMNYRIGYYKNGATETLRWSDSQSIDGRIWEFYQSTFKLLRTVRRNK